jgi:hypothetical protein
MTDTPKPVLTEQDLHKRLENIATLKSSLEVLEEPIPVGKLYISIGSVSTSSRQIANAALTSQLCDVHPEWLAEMLAESRAIVRRRLAEALRELGDDTGLYLRGHGL